MNTPLATRSGSSNCRSLTVRSVNSASVLVALYLFGVLPPASVLAGVSRGLTIEYSAPQGDVSSEVAPGSSPERNGTGDGEAPKATAAQSGLVIIPTFDSSILNHPNSEAIQTAINQAIAIYQALFGDPITVKILFRYSNRRSDGGFIRSGIIALVEFTAHDPPWDAYINALKADAKTGNDATANASLPADPLSPQFLVSSANGRALGFDTPGTLDATGTAGAGTFDGIATLNSNRPFQFTRPTSAANYDALRLIQGCISGVLGIASGVDVSASAFFPQDLFSWAAPANRNITSSGFRYFSIDGGNTKVVDFNQDSSQSFSLWSSPPCPQPSPYVNTAVPCLGQSANIMETSPEGIDLDVIGYDPPPTTLGNISTRLRVETGDNVLIGGFIVLSGTQSKKIIVRAIGPSLVLDEKLADPVLELRDSSGALIASNDDWRSDQEAEIIATTIPPSNDLESAIVATLPANDSGYTAIVRGKNNGTGIGVVEAYDLDTSANSKFANISTRGLVQTGDNVLIAGTIVVGSASADVLFRAIGPSLTGAGVPNVLQDPTLVLHEGNGGVVASNDNWRSNQEAEIIATTIPPANDLESAILRTLPPGAYTAIVRGKDGSTGVAVVEAYQLQ